jgi:8-oxo-dGTP diphosphatase
MTFSYPFARPALAVDCVVFGLRQAGLSVLLIERGLAPFEGDWALPGGFVRVDETIDAAAERELQEEAGVRVSYLEQLYTFGDLERDPRERVVSVAHYALVNPDGMRLDARTDARRAAWFDVRELPKLAFDHGRILAIALERLRSKVRYRPIGFGLLPERFSLTELQRAYEIVLDRPLDKRNFRKKVLALGFVVPSEERQVGVRHRAARLFRFDPSAYDRLVADGFDLVLV